jgi:hypothetical protein
MICFIVFFERDSSHQVVAGAALVAKISFNTAEMESKDRLLPTNRTSKAVRCLEMIQE